MILINLLPHREAARKRRKDNFQATLFASFLIGVAIAGSIYFYFQWRLESQQERINYLRTQITQVNQQIKEIQGLEDEIRILRARQEAVQSLQSNRNLPVYMFNDLVQLLPEGVFLNSIKQSGFNVEIRGSAQSNERVSEVLRNLGAQSPYFAKPVLREIVSGSVEVAPRDFRKVVNFVIVFNLVRPNEAAKKLQ
ncbi:MAG: PilN domain-containing protein [Comamonas sp.]|nr:PilN domain-containing protein [Comamonas sp.]